MPSRPAPPRSTPIPPRPTPSVPPHPIPSHPALSRAVSRRYIGTCAADLHRTFLYGGVFLYPGTKAAPNGKLRVLYEAGPMAFLAEQAAGLATNGSIPLLELLPGHVHQRTPVFIGSPEDVRELLEAFKAAA